jgi:CRP-like cAMP-binding protein
MISDALLQSVYLFSELTPDERAQLAKIAEPMTLAGGVPVFCSGDAASALYLVKDGSVRISTISAGGETVNVATLASGAHFGEMGLLDGARRSATVETLEPTSLFRFDYGRIRAALEASPPMAARVYRSFAQFLSHRLRQTTTDMSFAREKNLRHF